MKEVYEGEVTEMTPVETENPFGGSLYSNLMLNLNILELFFFNKKDMENPCHM